MKKTLLSLQNAPNFQPLSPDAQAQTKGGWLWTCEEKRRTIGSYSYTEVVWKLTDDKKYGKTTIMA